MKFHLTFPLLCLALGLLPAAAQSPAKSTALPPPPPFLLLPRVIPPLGEKLTDANRTELTATLEKLTQQLAALPRKPANANAEVFLKAVRYAIDHKEFYKPEDTAKARTLLDEAAKRLVELAAGRAPWLTDTGYVVRGYYSAIDGSAQPFALEIPENTPAQNAPAWFWLQGRGDTRTDLHFIAEHLKKGGEFKPPDTLIVHPWGRYCIGYKGPGEQDVLDVRQLLINEKRIDPTRTALAGFSMGGAGAWLLGSHFTDRWAVVHTGAGFVDVQRYQKLSQEKIAATPAWEKTLWGQNDIPGYTRNLLNVPVISYSGEVDAQRASAEIMAEEFQKHGAALTQYIGPKMGHKYDPAVRQQVQEKVQDALLHPTLPSPLKLSFQTRTLAYPSLHWLKVTGLEEHWQDTRVEAELDKPLNQATKLSVTTKNVTSFSIGSPEQPPFRNPVTINIDGQSLTVSARPSIHVRKENGSWILDKPGSQVRKKPGLQGPIDDAFNAPFLHVLPDKAGFHPATDAWVLTESAAQISRWRTLFRGDARVKTASQVTPDDIKSYNLILWGDPASNKLIAAALPKLPIQWTADSLTANGKATPTAGHLPVLIHPSPSQNDRYIVLNSGPTWREAHSKTNSLQNPKLPDWAILDITSPPTPEAAGKVEAAGFFNESWGWK
ncbi:MAG: phospholipase/Carboxylesterase [Verrucomicrobiales bacterium]|nr:phospholipase/Carboxylesterase [Verrucomicrobiales bacterium]